MIGEMYSIILSALFNKHFLNASVLLHFRLTSWDLYRVWYIFVHIFCDIHCKRTICKLYMAKSASFLCAGHDCSIRLWNLDSKTCVQEITSHRKKFDESIHDVAFHPQKPYIASAGADALAKVFVWQEWLVEKQSPARGFLSCQTDSQSTSRPASLLILK